MNADEKFGGARLVEDSAFLYTLYNCYIHLKKELRAKRVTGYDVYSVTRCWELIEPLLDSADFLPPPPAPAPRSPSQSSVSSPTTSRPGGEAAARTENDGSQRNVSSGGEDWNKEEEETDYLDTTELSNTAEHWDTTKDWKDEEENGGYWD